MTALVLAIACSSGISLLLKDNDVRGGEPLTLLAGNYLMATVLGVVFVLVAPDRAFSWQSAALGAALGVGFVSVFFVFAKAVGAAGAALATVSSRVSLVIPVVLSIVLFTEVPDVYQYAGLAVAGVTLLFFYLSTRTGPEHHDRSAYLLLVLLFVGIGVNDFVLKLFSEWRPVSEKPFFLLCIFASSLVYTVAVSRLRGLEHDRQTLLRGLVLGVPNIFSSFFLLAALATMDAVVVYPTVNVGIIVVTTAAAAAIWRERLDRWGALAVLTGIGAIVLMGLG